MSALGTTIRQLREAEQISLRALASMAGISAGHLSRIERDQKPLTENTVIAIAQALGHDEEELLLLSGRLSPGLVEAVSHDPRQALRLLRGLARSRGPAYFLAGMAMGAMLTKVGWMLL